MKMYLIVVNTQNGLNFILSHTANHSVICPFTTVNTALHK